MAGEMEEPFSISFQGGSIHSGSISFGRFENEPLCWERRSSFSHNRYLEEVEKCSKPGSVIEKKAYFEAHFKRKALLAQGSSGDQNGTYYQTSENDPLESVDYREEFAQVNENSCSSHFDNSPEGSDYREECEEIEDEGENWEPSSSDVLTENVSNRNDVLVDDVVNSVSSKDIHQIEVEGEKSVLVDDEPQIEDKQVLAVDAEHSGESSKAKELPKNEATERFEVSADCQESSSQESTVVTNSKLTKSQMKSQISSSPTQRKADDKIKNDVKSSNRRDKDGSQRIKREKLLLLTTVSATRTLHRSPKQEDFQSSRSSINHNKKSETEHRQSKALGSRSTTLNKSESSTRSIASRIVGTMNSGKEQIRSNATAFHFKSDKRAEKRKEFNMKLEEKMHAKEAEMNQIQARTQERTKAEIKQFRKSLNFKATPMPSFYHATAPQRSNENKAVSSKSGSVRFRKASGTAAASPFHNSTPEPFVQNSHCAGEPSGAGAPPTAPVSKSYIPEAAPGNKGNEKKERPREKDANLRKHQVTESSRMAKGQLIQGKQKARDQRSSSERVGKDMRGPGFGSSSGISHLAVGVAS